MTDESHRRSGQESRRAPARDGRAQFNGLPGSSRGVAIITRGRYTEDVPATSSIRAALPFGLLGAIVVVQAVLLWDLSGRVAATIDEEVYITAGVAQVVRGNPFRNPEHPPLAKDFIGLAVRAHDARAGREHGSPIIESVLWTKPLESQRSVLRAARMPSMALALVTTVAAFWGATLLAGAGAGLIAALLFAFSPVALAHGSMATLDATVTCMSTLALISTYQAWKLRGGRRLFGVGIAGIYLGLALGTKLSALYMLPVIFFACVWGGFRRRELRPTVIFLLVGLLVSALTLWAVHKFSVSTVHGLPVPMNRYFKGLEFQLKHAESGHLNYLWGQVGYKGWWYYFLVALAVKIPHAVQALFFIGAFFALRPGPAWRSRVESWLLPLAYPLFLFLCMSFASTVQIGVKYLLPSAPLAYVAIGSSMAGWLKGSLAKKVMLGGLLSLVLWAPLGVHPHELMYYNELAGGPELGWRYTVHGDDLGQDQNRVAPWMKREGLGQIAYAKYSAQPEHFGIRYRKVPCRPSLGVSALHVIELVRPSWAPPRCFDWLQGRTPDDKIGFTIFVYRITAEEVTALRQGQPKGEPPLEKWGDPHYLWSSTALH